MGSPPARRLVRLLVGLLLTLVVAAVILVLAGSFAPARIGYKTMVVTSGSMAPSIRTGDAVLLRLVHPDAIRRGDVITFKTRESVGMTTHRVVSLKRIRGELHFQTKGDANKTPDPNLAPAGSIYGRVVATMPKMGFLLRFATTSSGRAVLICLPVLFLMGQQLRALWGRRDTRHGR